LVTCVYAPAGAPRHVRRPLPAVNLNAWEFGIDGRRGQAQATRGFHRQAGSGLAGRWGNIRPRLADAQTRLLQYPLQETPNFECLAGKARGSFLRR
jgi:hypothetical protein